MHCGFSTRLTFTASRVNEQHLLHGVIAKPCKGAVSWLRRSNPFQHRHCEPEALLCALAGEAIPYTFGHSSGAGDCFVTAPAQKLCFVPRNDGLVNDTLILRLPNTCVFKTCAAYEAAAEK